VAGEGLFAVFCLLGLVVARGFRLVLLSVICSWMLKCSLFGSQMASKLLMTIPKNIRDFSQLMKALMEKEIGFACLFLNILR